MAACEMRLPRHRFAICANPSRTLRCTWTSRIAPTRFQPGTRRGIGHHGVESSRSAGRSPSGIIGRLNPRGRNSLRLLLLELGRGHVHSTAIDADFVADRSTQQLVDWLAKCLPENVPRRDVESTDRRSKGAAAPEARRPLGLASLIATATPCSGTWGRRSNIAGRLLARERARIWLPEFRVEQRLVAEALVEDAAFFEIPFSVNLHELVERVTELEDAE